VDGVIYLYQLGGSPLYLSSLTEPTTKLDPESSSAADVFAAADGDVIGVLPYASSNFSSLNVADHVAAEAGGYCDFGIIPKPQAYSDGTTYASSENANENQRPYLTITYLALVPPAAPSDVAAAIDGDEIAVTWTDNASGETGYKYKVAYDGGEYGEAVIMEDSADAESVSFTPEEGWATVKVAVAAYSDGGDSEYAESALLVKPVPVKTYPAVVGHLWLCSGLRRAVLRSAR
jgi:hypothetical protein